MNRGGAWIFGGAAAGCALIASNRIASFSLTAIYIATLLFLLFVKSEEITKVREKIYLYLTAVALLMCLLFIYIL